MQNGDGRGSLGWGKSMNDNFACVCDAQTIHWIRAEKKKGIRRSKRVLREKSKDSNKRGRSERIFCLNKPKMSRRKDSNHGEKSLNHPVGPTHDRPR